MGASGSEIRVGRREGALTGAEPQSPFKGELSSVSKSQSQDLGREKARARGFSAEQGDRNTYSGALGVSLNLKLSQSVCKMEV